MSNKKSPLAVMMAAILTVLLAGGFFLVTAAEEEPEPEPDVKVIESGDIAVHFLELGNWYSGDCVYIQYGDIDVIIDAGSRTSSATTIINYVNKYIKDDKIEYVIATHAHQDHIAGFYAASNNGNKGVLDAFEIGTIIDYPRSDSTSQTRGNYEAARDRLVAGGTEHYTALECYNKSKEGALREYDLGPGVKLEILYNYYYDHKATTENDYSVCVKIVNGNEQYLFTGDLEEKGEKGLVDHYGTELGHCTLFKGGHHGSSTSSNEVLMDIVTPDYVIICTCAGSSEYSPTPSNQFPTQEFINRIAKYTDNVYVTTVMYDNSTRTYGSLNGNIIFSVTDGEVTIICSASDKKLKDTEWFKTYRVVPEKWAAADAG